MLIQPDEGEPYDRFRGRLMIPVRDARGRVIAFGGRILGDGEPKYLNSPDTPIFDKGRTLYNLDLAGPASRQAKRLIVVEGYMDVIASTAPESPRSSPPTAPRSPKASSSGCGGSIRRRSCASTATPPGRKAAIRAATRALPHLGPERTLRFVELPAGQDPDDLVRSGGRAALEELLAAPEPLDQRLWRHERDAAPLATPEARAGLRQRLVDHADAIGDPELRRLYRDQWLDRFAAEMAKGRPQRRPWQPSQRFTPGQRYTRRPAGPAGDAARRSPAAASTPPPPAPSSRASSISRRRSPAIASSSPPSPIPDRALSALRDQLVDAALSGGALDREALATILQAAGAEAGHGQALGSGGIGFSFTRSDAEPERAVRDLGVAIDALVAEEEIGAALDEATERLMAGDEDAFGEQLRLHSAREEIKQRLASLAGTE